MAEPYSGEPLSRSVYLALQDEQRLVQDGYEFLDEKRILLAAELLRQRDDYRELSRTFTELMQSAASALGGSVTQHGLDGVQVQPALAMMNARLQTAARSYVGMTLLDCRFEAEDADLTFPSVHPTPELRACAQAFRKLLALGARLAAVSCNINRLIREYRRTERRTRALENVILPELGQALAQAEAYLEMLDQEEVVRVRFRKGNF